MCQAVLNVAKIINIDCTTLDLKLIIIIKDIKWHVIKLM